MNTLPALGTRVRYEGSSVVGPCEGTITKIYPALNPAPGFDEEDVDCQYVKAPFDPFRWKVRMVIEGELPVPFIYPNTNAFCPSIAEIELAKLAKDDE